MKKDAKTIEMLQRLDNVISSLEYEIHTNAKKLKRSLPGHGVIEAEFDHIEFKIGEGSIHIGFWLNQAEIFAFEENLVLETGDTLAVYISGKLEIDLEGV